MYTDLATIEARLGRLLTYDEAVYFSDVLNGAIKRLIDEKTETTFGSDEVIDVYVDGDNTSVLNIPTMHDITEVNDADGNEVTEYLEYPKAKNHTMALRLKSGLWAEGVENYRVTGKYGYGEVPADVKMASTDLAVSTFTEALNNYKSEKVGDWSVTYDTVKKQLSPEIDAVLNKYKRLSRSI
jgi:hypothetical protein